MFKVSKKTDYVLLALQDLASLGEPGDLSARVTFERFEIPPSSSSPESCNASPVT